MDKIRVEMKCNDRFFNAGMAAAVIVLAIWFAVMLTYFSVVSLVLFLICTGLFVGIVIAFEKIPTIAEADGNELRWKHLLGWKTIRYADILTINCEPEELRGRYSSTQCMRLLITAGDGECELSQIVNTNKMLQDRLDGQETDIPVMRLYEFIKEKSGK